MGCNRTPTEKEAQQIHESATKVAAEVGADVGRAEYLVRAYGETTARMILASEEQARHAAFAPPPPPPPSYSFEQPVWASASAWSSPPPPPVWTSPPPPPPPVWTSPPPPPPPVWTPPPPPPATWSPPPPPASGWGSSPPPAAPPPPVSPPPTSPPPPVVPPPPPPSGPTVTSGAGVQFSYTFASAKDYPPLPADGTPVVFAKDVRGNSVGEARLLGSGVVAIKTCLNDGTGSLWSGGRQKYESFLPLGNLMGFAGHARAHAAGQGTGPESPYGIAFAKEAINKFQNEGVEEDIRRIADQLLPGVRLEQKLDVTTDPTGLRLQSISYQVEAVLPNGRTHVLYEQGITVSGPVGKERVELDYEEPRYSPNIEHFLRPV